MFFRKGIALGTTLLVTAGTSLVVGSWATGAYLVYRLIANINRGENLPEGIRVEFPSIYCAVETKY